MTIAEILAIKTPPTLDFLLLIYKSISDNNLLIKIPLLKKYISIRLKLIQVLFSTHLFIYKVLSKKYVNDSGVHTYIYYKNMYFYNKLITLYVFIIHIKEKQ